MQTVQNNLVKSPFLDKMIQGSSSNKVDKTVRKDPMVGFRKGKSHPNH
jgi:hypothetical protein